jgi:hypothetical protein
MWTYLSYRWRHSSDTTTVLYIKVVVKTVLVVVMLLFLLAMRDKDVTVVYMRF